MPARLGGVAIAPLVSFPVLLADVRAHPPGVAGDGEARARVAAGPDAGLDRVDGVARRDGRVHGVAQPARQPRERGAAGWPGCRHLAVPVRCAQTLPPRARAVHRTMVRATPPPAPSELLAGLAPGRRPGRRASAAREARSQASGASARRLREVKKDSGRRPGRRASASHGHVRGRTMREARSQASVARIRARNQVAPEGARNQSMSARRLREKKESGGGQGEVGCF